MKSISRRKPAQLNGNQQPSLVQNSPAGTCIEVGKFGLEEEVERLKRDKNVLMQELVRLRQQQQATDSQLQNVGQRVQVMEQRQQQMMSFLAKAMQSPSFLAQFVQQQSDSNRHITGGNKKRRLHRQEDTLSTEHLHSAFDGRVIKYQPSMNEAAKALLHQILQMNASSRMESSVNNPDAFLIDDVPSAIPLDSGSSSSRASGVTLSEVPPTSGQSYMGVQSEFPVNCMPNGISELQSSSALLNDSVKVAEFPELNLDNCPEDVLDFGKVQGAENGTSLLNPELTFMGPDVGNKGDIDMMSAVLDGTHSVEVEAGAFSPDPDGISRLPSINDVFWEQFLTASPLMGDTDEISSCTLGGGFTKDTESPSAKENGLEKMDKIKHIDHLTQQMELLASETS